MKSDNIPVYGVSASASTHCVPVLHSCDCNPIGSTNGQCDIVTGQCECQPGITGLHCQRCEVNFFGFSASGCKRE